MSLLWIVIIAIFVFGAVSLALGLRGRRINDHPICRKCRFDLVGVYASEDTTDGGTGVSPVNSSDNSPRCPECGRDLNTKRAVRIGARRKRPFALTTGAFLLLIAIAIGGAWGWGRSSNFNWNTIKPTWWLMTEATGPDTTTAQAALTELLARAGNDELSNERLMTLATTGLNSLRDKPAVWVVGYGDALELAWSRGLFSEEHVKSYARHALVLHISADDHMWRSTAEFAVRRVQIDGELPLEVNLLPHVGTTSRLMGVLEVLGASVDGDAVAIDSHGWWFAPIAFGGGSAAIGEPIPLAAGQHRVTMDFRIMMYELPTVGTPSVGSIESLQVPDGAQLLLSYEEHLSAHVNVQSSSP
jgi:hypothetical protein